MSTVRVRFAPSPTGGLHLGGVRTILYNYLFAKQNGGKFILRIEDTDQSRYVEGAEQYIFDCLEWCGLIPDEGVVQGGDYGPYRQSERKALYAEYAERLVTEGKAYYAFDTTEEIETMRTTLKSAGKNSLQYDASSRTSMRNSLTLMPEETKTLLQNGTPYVIRLKVEPTERVAFDDLIRGHIELELAVVDDKVLLKADGMPTYHLAVVVDDYLMKITHAFRGEEWLPSAPVHILLWKYLFGLDNMPKWAHLPLIMKPDGNGKLSKRDGERLGFPVFALQWPDASGNMQAGFKERGFLPEAFLNMLAVLGWHDGTEQELFSLEELIEKFDLDRVHVAGAKFDFEKAKWFNAEWIKKLPTTNLIPYVKKVLVEENIHLKDDDFLVKIIDLVKERCTLFPDFYEQSKFFFVSPVEVDTASIQPKWNADKVDFFNSFTQKIEDIANWTAESIEATFKEEVVQHGIKPGELLMPFRIMLVGAKYGPGVFEIAALIGKEETKKRIEFTLKALV